MKPLLFRFLALAAALLPAASAVNAQLVVANPVGSAFASSHFLGSDQFLAARFSFAHSLDVTAVAATFSGAQVEHQSFFAALVELDSSTLLPRGIPFTADEVIAHAVFQPGLIEAPTLITVPLSAYLQPGDYGVVFGSGQFGAVGGGGLQNYRGISGSSSFTFVDNTKYTGWIGWSDADFDYIAGGIPHYDIRLYANPVPEPATWGFAGVALLCVLIGRRRFSTAKRVSAIGSH